MYVYFAPFSLWRSSLPYPPINKASNMKSSSPFLTLNFWLLQPQRFELVLRGWRIWQYMICCPPFFCLPWEMKRWKKGPFMLFWFLPNFILQWWVKFDVMTIAYYYFFGLSSRKKKSKMFFNEGLGKCCITFSSSLIVFPLLDCMALHTLTRQTRLERPERRWTSPNSFHHLVDLNHSNGNEVALWKNDLSRFQFSQKKAFC